jgi:hypothetical protein
MALSKTIKINKVEFVGEWKKLQVRYVTEVKDGEEVIAQSYSRDGYFPNQELPTDLQPYADGVWTEEFIAEYQAEVDAEQASLDEELAGIETE